MRLKGKSPLSSVQFKGTVCQFWSHAIMLCGPDKMRKQLHTRKTLKMELTDDSFSVFNLKKNLHGMSSQALVTIPWLKCSYVPLTYEDVQQFFQSTGKKKNTWTFERVSCNIAQGNTDWTQMVRTHSLQAISYLLSMKYWVTNVIFFCSLFETHQSLSKFSILPIVYACFFHLTLNEKCIYSFNFTL